MSRRDVQTACAVTVAYAKWLAIIAAVAMSVGQVAVALTLMLFATLLVLKVEQKMREIA